MRFPSILSAAAILLSAAACQGSTITAFDVSLTLTPLSGQTGYIAFDFFGGTPVENNSVTIDGFSSDSTLGAPVYSGSASGSLVPGPATLNDSQFFNEIAVPVTFGTTATFTLSLTTNSAASGIPDSFSLFLLNSSFVPFGSTDPTGAGAMFTINITGPQLTPAVYTSAFASAGVTPVSTATPEPATALSALLGAFALFALRRRRNA